MNGTTSTSASSKAFGSGILNFGVRSLLSKRKKSAPEQEFKKNILNTDNEDCASKPYIPVCNQTSSQSSTYQIYLNESCSVEVNALQQNSSVSNILSQVRNKN